MVVVSALGWWLLESSVSQMRSDASCFQAFSRLPGAPEKARTGELWLSGLGPGLHASVLQPLAAKGCKVGKNAALELPYLLVKTAFAGISVAAIDATLVRQLAHR